MPSHLHTDVITLTAAAAATLLIAHVMRMIGAWAANHGADTLGKAWGAFWSLPA